MPQKNKTLDFAIVIPAYNEENFVGLCLESLLGQSLLPSKIIVVDDGSSDKTSEIVEKYTAESKIINIVKSTSSLKHEPGAKVINAFKRGLNHISQNDFDVICKFDADLEFPKNYIEKLNHHFLSDENLGLCGGICSIKKNDNWQPESLTNLDHVRGALKAYRLKAFNEIRGLDSQMGWDTADEFKLRYRNYNIKVDNALMVKHHKPTATSYKDDYFKTQGKVFYALRYGWLLTLIASLKIVSNRKDYDKFGVIIYGFKNSKSEGIDFLLSEDEGKYLRKYRWKHIFKKLFHKKTA